ncbi:MAG: DJ-1/PfpI family protein [Clostridia bacterium]|nr:DJ-1/PfpI family protein [Clostridia bacterium]
MVYVLLADGFEEIEALAPVDLMRRAGLNVKTLAVGEGLTVRGAHGICVEADGKEADADGVDGVELIVLPGGMPGTMNLDSSKAVHRLIDLAVSNKIRIAAICAAPMILGKLGLLCGKRATCYPGFEEYLDGAELCEALVVTDGLITTSKGAGAAVDFGLELVSLLCGEKIAENIGHGIFAR